VLNCLNINSQNSVLRLRPEPNPVFYCYLGRLNPHGECFCGAEARPTCHGGHKILEKQIELSIRVNHCLKKYEILTVYSLYILECMKFLKKNPQHFTKQCDMPFVQLRTTRNNQTNSCCNDLFVPKCDLKMSNQNPAVMIPRIYNALPLKIKMIECDKTFMKSVKTFVTDRQFYDMHEFFSCY
jgi:hypothetical protein